MIAMPMFYHCLSIGLEKGLFVPNNRARNRIAKYGAFLEQLDIIVLATQPFDDFIAPNVHVISTNSSSRWWYVFDALRLIWKRRKNKYDIVLSQDIAEMGFLAYVGARVHHAAFAVHDVGYFFHGSYFFRESFGNKLRTLLGNWLLKRVDAIRVMSKRSEDILVQERNIPPEAIVRYPFAVDEQFFAPIAAFSKEEADITAGRPYFLIPARFVEIKRIDLAIRAFANVAKLHSEPLLVLVGQGPLLESYQQLVKKLELEQRVRFVAWTQAMTTWYSQALATLITSDREGYAMTALESLLCHTPVIMTDVGCANEIVRDQDTGYVVPIGDVAAISQAMVNVLLETHPVKKGAIAFTYQPPVRETQAFIDLAVGRHQGKYTPKT